MKIAHSYCLNNNIGDHALGIGVKNIFRTFYNVSLFADYNLQGQIFNEYFIDIINNKYDLLIIGGGGIIHGAHWPQGWFWLIEKENIKKIKIPFIIYAAGYNYFKDEKGIPQIGIDHLIETHKRAAYFSVRNDGSHDRLLNQTGINANVIADPGFWIPTNFTNKSDNPDTNYIVVQLANDKPEHRFGTLDKRKIFVKKLQSVLIKLSSKYKIVFAPHVYEDIEISKQVAEKIKNSTILNFGEYAFDKTNEYINTYRDSEFVLAMRGHGQIIPLGLEIPVISLENHSKHKGLMEEYGLEQYNINILDIEFTTKLEEKITQLLTNIKNIKEHCHIKNKQLFENTSKQIKNISEISKYLKK